MSLPELASAPAPVLLTCQAKGTENKLAVAQYRTDDFAELYRSGYPRLVAALRLAGATDGPDLAQEAFARTLGHWRRVRQGSNPAGYVTTTAFGYCVDTGRRRWCRWKTPTAPSPVPRR